MITLYLPNHLQGILIKWAICQQRICTRFPLNFPPLVVHHYTIDQQNRDT
jgi:hypothetical protein